MQSEKLWGEVATGAQGGNKGLKQQLLWISYNNNKELPLRAQVRMDEIILTLCPSSPRLDVLSENLGMSFKVIYFSINLDCALCSVTQLCMTLWNPMDCSPPGSSVCGILLARILEGCHALLQIFPTQGANPCLLCLLPWQAGSLPLALLGKASRWLTTHNSVLGCHCY